MRVLQTVQKLSLGFYPIFWHKWSRRYYCEMTLLGERAEKMRIVEKLWFVFNHLLKSSCSPQCSGYSGDQDDHRQHSDTG